MRVFFRSFDRGDFRMVTSTVTLVEVLVHPLRQGNTILAQEYREILLNQESLTVVELTPDIAETAGNLEQLTICDRPILFKWLQLSVRVLRFS